MKMSDAFPSRFMGKDDIKRETTLHIALVEMQNIGSAREIEEKPVIEWQEPDAKPFICNATNWETIADAYGPESDDWKGKALVIYLDPSIKFAGKRVGGLRVKAAKPESHQPTKDVQF